MTYQLDGEALQTMAEALARCGELAEATGRALERFAREMWQIYWSSPRLLRSLPKGRAKKERRRIGRRIRNLEKLERARAGVL